MENNTNSTFELSENRTLDVDVVRGTVNVNIRDKREKGEDGLEKPSKRMITFSSEQWKKLIENHKAISDTVSQLEGGLANTKKPKRKAAAKPPAADSDAPTKAKVEAKPSADPKTKTKRAAKSKATQEAVQSDEPVADSQEGL